TIHRTFQRWVEINLFEMIWSLLAAECDELALINWEWQAADGWLGKARSGGDEIGPNPTDRAKNGTKKSVLTDAAGGPLLIVIAPANVNDHKLLEATIKAMVIERPEPTEQAPQNLCLDKGYDNKPGREVVKKHGYKDHIRRRCVLRHLCFSLRLLWRQRFPHPRNQLLCRTLLAVPEKVSCAADGLIIDVRRFLLYSQYFQTTF